MLKRILIISGVVALAACGGKTKSKSSPAAATPAPDVLPYGGGASSYPGSTLNPDVALNGMGQWVTVGNQRFFIPSNLGADWAPYQDGYWMYDEQRGWTWVSNDRFGWLTDHYGIWRHHNRHGWIWMPFHDLHYEAHSVSWFDQGENSAYLGWFPYNSSYNRGYVLDQRHGFDDGFWRGDRAVLEFSTGRFTFGLSLVNRENVCERNVRRHLVADSRFVMNFAFNALRTPERTHYDARFPGGHRDRSFGYVQLRSRTKPVRGEARVVRSEGGARFLQPQEIRDNRDERRDHDVRRDREDNRRVYVPVKRDEPKRDEPKRVEVKKEEIKKEEVKKEEVKPDEVRRDDKKRVDNKRDDNKLEEMKRDDDRKGKRRRDDAKKSESSERSAARDKRET